jgi:hypothetical protein
VQTTTPANLPAPAASPTGTLAPADQLAPVMLRLGSMDGARHISMQLTPDSLGRVDITVDQPKDGAVTVRLTADNPQTLAMLEQDKASLDTTLDRAGLASADRVVSFHLAAPHAVAATADAVPSSQPAPALGTGTTTGQYDGTSQQQQRQGGSMASFTGRAMSPGTQDDGSADWGIDWNQPAAAPITGHARALLNITA